MIDFSSACCAAVRRVAEMAVDKAQGNVTSSPLPLPDAELLALFATEPDRAWRLFIDRYADMIFSYLQRLGFDYDQAMDRFLYVCEKLCEQDFRRLKTIKYTGRSGDLTPWIRKTVKNLSINWAWSVEGRKRLLKPIQRLPAREQRIFELYFWKGLSPSRIHEQLRLEHHELDMVEVLDALERIFSLLSRKKLWRLMSNLASARGEVSLDEIDEETGLGLEAVSERANPEEALLEKEAEERISSALDGLSTRERLAIEFRYTEAMAVKDVAAMLGLSEREVKNSLKSALNKLRRTLK